MADEHGPDEAGLVRRCAQGDAAAWETFVDAYGGLLTVLARRMLLRRTGHARDEDVDEIVAEVFLALLRRDRDLLRRYDPRWRLATWLGVVCRTAVGRLLRRRRMPTGAEGDDQVDPHAPPEGMAGLTGVDRDAALAALDLGLSALPPRDRQLLVLRFLDGLDYQAIAEVLDLAPESVGSLLSRAKRRLAEAVRPLEDLLGEDL